MDLACSRLGSSAISGKLDGRRAAILAIESNCTTPDLNLSIAVKFFLAD
jgi:hypothetical protein